MINKKRALDTLIDYLRIDSETGKEKEIMERIIADFGALGFRVETDDAGSKCGSTGNNVYCYVEGDLPAERILLGAHMDTVKPGAGVEPVIEGEYLRSKGDTILGGDDKSGIIVILEALRTAVENKQPLRPLDIVLTISEETGLHGAKNLEFNRIRARQGVILDSQGTAAFIKTKAPGMNRLKFTVKGKKAHAGAFPEKGVSAIMAAAEAVANMKLLRLDEETTANIGSFIADAGGTNIVCDHAVVRAETRSFSLEKLNAQTAHMVQCFEAAAKKYHAEVTCEVMQEMEPYAYPDDHFLVGLIKEKCIKHGLDGFTMSDGGGSDANIFAQNGIAALAIGNGMDKVHTLEEELHINEFLRTIAVVHSMITEAE